MTNFQLFITILGAVKFAGLVFHLVGAVEAPRGRRGHASTAWFIERLFKWREIEAPRRSRSHQKTT